jgi:non-canonical purine NTP pyrophosphatase (RdgB/HAM1 family)
MKEANVTFITGNKNKAEYLEKLLGLKIKHQKLDLDEIQSLSLQEVVEHKVKQAFAILKTPVLVEDVGLFFEELGGLPGPFVRFFVDQVPFEKICKMVGENRKAIASCVFGYFDGEDLKFFEGKLQGRIATEPKGENGYGWDRIFIPEGYTITRAEMSEGDNLKTYQIIKPIQKVREFLVVKCK